MDQVKYLKEMFRVIKKYGMRLNPKKFVFGITSGKLQGYLISSSGIEANPVKIQAIVTIIS